MSTDGVAGVTPEVARLLERAVKLTNQALGGLPEPDRLELDRPSLSTGDLINRVRALVRIKAYVDSLIDTEALAAVEQGATYAAVGRAAGLSRARAHQLWPRPKLFGETAVLGPLAGDSTDTELRRG